jgi:hypothetical protein
MVRGESRGHELVAGTERTPHGTEGLETSAACRRRVVSCCVVEIRKPQRVVAALGRNLRQAFDEASPFARSLTGTNLHLASLKRISSDGRRLDSRCALPPAREPIGASGAWRQPS